MSSKAKVPMYDRVADLLRDLDKQGFDVVATNHGWRVRNPETGQTTTVYSTPDGSASLRATVRDVVSIGFVNMAVWQQERRRRTKLHNQAAKKRMEVAHQVADIPVAAEAVASGRVPVWVTLQEAANLLGISAAGAHQAWKRGRLGEGRWDKLGSDGRKVGVEVRLEDVEAYDASKGQRKPGVPAADTPVTEGTFAPGSVSVTAYNRDRMAEAIQALADAVDKFRQAFLGEEE